MTEENKSFWAVVELMGHAKLAGLVTEVELGGAKLLRVDVPEVPERPARGYYGAQPAIPAYTRLVGGSAIYAITPMTEEACQQAVQQFRVSPVTAVGMGHLERVVVQEAPKQLAAASETDILRQAASLMELEGQEEIASVLLDTANERDSEPEEEGIPY